MATISLIVQKKLNGHQESPVITLPGNLTGTFILQSEMVLSDLQDPNKSMAVMIYKSADGGTTWQEVAGYTWQGGSLTDLHGNLCTPPALTIDGAQLAGLRMKAVVDIASPITVGFSVIRAD